MTISRIILSLLISLNLLVSVGGVPVVIHTCGGVIESIHVFAFSAHCADTDDGSSCEEDECCSNTLAVAQWNYDGVPMAPAHGPVQQLHFDIVPCIELPFKPVLLSSIAPLRNHETGERPPPPDLMSMRC